VQKQMKGEEHVLKSIGDGEHIPIAFESSFEGARNHSLTSYVYPALLSHTAKVWIKGLNMIGIHLFSMLQSSME